MEFNVKNSVSFVGFLMHLKKVTVVINSLPITYEIYHNSRLIRRIEQEKNYQKLVT